MNSKWNAFFEAERKRIVEPGPYFVQRVMAHVGALKTAPLTLWDTVPNAFRAALGVAFAVLFGVLTVHLLFPVEPSRAALEPFGTDSLSSQEQMLIADPQLPTGAAQFEELMVLEPVQ